VELTSERASSRRSEKSRSKPPIQSPDSDAPPRPFVGQEGSKAAKLAKWRCGANGDPHLLQG
jgi:hypothetical protein